MSNCNCPTNAWKKAKKMEKYEEMEKEGEGDEEMRNMLLTTAPS